MMRKFFAIALVLGIVSCGPSKTEEETNPAEESFKPETILIDDSNLPFGNDSIPLVLEQVKLCKMMDSVTQDTTVPPCDYRLMRYFANHREPVRDGFLVEIKPNVWSKWFLVVAIARNKDGEYYKSNAFHGQLMELRTTKSGPYDMIIRYVDAEVGTTGKAGTVAILHKWNKTKYDPVEVMEINDYYVKPEYKDSLNEVYLKEFVWGY
ncbi:MAG TPA: hypothetical protein VK177_04695 [Flavobacteriales bacterium]|nr:hypothetical protein [Flavobacteriales bacterium]